ncbi:MAG: preprotein translocase subunit SecE [Chloroflexi bacterium]|nr:preprotein translocase subunit SecE [Chloroflexota bacterium]MCH7952759.1 preprotein translocase subunit SecE [Chloroflexota bacterium]MCI0831195.1 preprotein translocase subunit SecE [Chloroflexota bacterium]MCI0839736.1 preprotein translocase subunit SecE [Chloroflexota bacterium]MCI0884977.1 preprotein translocase subunit SecE [Chloroflexota bacterium]
MLSWRPQILVDVITELRKVVWPSRPDVLHLTVVVVIVTLILGAVLGAIDIGFGYIIDEALLN